MCTSSVFDLMVGKNGDHIGGERQAFDCLASGAAAASALIDPELANLDPGRHR